MGRELIEDLMSVATSLFTTAGVMRNICESRRGPAWRVLNAAASTVEATGHTVRSLYYALDEQDEHGVPGFTSEELSETREAVR